MPRTHDLDHLLTLVMPHDGDLGRLRRGMVLLTQFAVDYRYPGQSARHRQAATELRWAERIRIVLRDRLGLRS